MNCEDKKKTAIKLHKQFCHVQASRVNKLLKNAGVNDRERLKTVEAVSENCKTCKLYSRTPPKPIVAIPFAKMFNEHVAMDLKDINSKKVLHIIDHATRFWHNACSTKRNR